MKMKSTDLTTELWQTAIITDLHLDIDPFTTTLQVQSHKQLVTHQTACESNPYFFYFGQKDVV